SYSHSPTVVNRYPTCPGGGVHQGVEQRPISNSIRAVRHPLGFPIGRGNTARIQVIATDHHRSTKLTTSHHFVEAQSGKMPFTVAEPTDPSGQSLERDPFTSQPNPAG